MVQKCFCVFVFVSTVLWNVVPVAADIVSVVANGPNANIETISQVVISVTDGTGTNLVTQNVSVTGTTQGVSSAILQSITTTAGVLDSFNPVTPTIANSTFPTSGALGIQVLTPSQAVGVTDSNFLSALAETHANGDLVNYLRVDGGSFTPQWDILYGEAVNSNDFLVFEERNGNTTFTVEPLDINGDPIAGSDTLSFNSASYQWSIGLSNSLDPNGSQPQVLGVVDFDLFGTSTPIGGFRINDTGNADFKFFIGTLAVPEPGSAVVIALLGLCGLRRRRLSSVDGELDR